MSRTVQSHRERIETCLSGSIPDKIPSALWRHFPVDDQNPYSLAAAVSLFQRTYDFDFIKITPASSFCIRDWGAVDEWKGEIEGTRQYVNHPIRHPDDWTQLKKLSPTQGALGDQLTCIRQVVQEFSHDVPIIQTVFSPLAQAKNLVGKDQLLIHLRRYPEQVLAGLKIISETTLDFVSELAKTGIDGIFYAVQHAQYGLLSEGEFSRFQMPFDIEVLEPVRSFWFNVGHIHGEQVMFDQMADYPLQVLNWHDRHTPPGLIEAQKKFPGVVCGGLRRWETMVLGSPEDVQMEAWAAAEETGGRRFILGTGCVLPTIAPHGNILAASRCFLKGESK